MPVSLDPQILVGAGFSVPELTLAALTDDLDNFLIDSATEKHREKGEGQATSTLTRRPRATLGSLSQLGDLFHSHQEPLFNAWPGPLPNLIGKTKAAFTHGAMTVTNRSNSFPAHKQHLSSNANKCLSIPAILVRNYSANLRMDSNPGLLQRHEPVTRRATSGLRHLAM